MRQLITILTATIILLSCEKQREQVEKFVFDTKQITSRTIHNYQFYPDGKIRVDNSITYYSRAGVPFDSVSRQEYFTYNAAGKLESKFDPTDSTKRLYVYNEIDSLVGDFAINTFGDTSFLAITEYKDNKVARRINRMLSAKIPNDPDDIKKMKMEDLRKYDTLLYISELEYNGDKLEKTISKDKDGNITGKVYEFYEDGRKVKTVTYSFIGDAKYVSEIKVYSDSNINDPDYFATGPQGDTIGYKQTIFQDNTKTVIYHWGQSDRQSIFYYDERGQLIGSIDIDMKENTRLIYSYKYDDKGNEIEEANYKEKLSNAR